MFQTFRSDDLIDAGLRKSLERIRETSPTATHSTAHDKLMLANALLYMYPEESDFIVEALYPFIEEASNVLLRSSIPPTQEHPLTAIWRKLAALRSTIQDPEIDHIVDYAQQRFLDGTGSLSNKVLVLLLDDMQDYHGETYRAITRHTNKHNGINGVLRSKLDRMEAAYLARAIRNNDMYAIEALVQMGSPTRALSGAPHGSWIHEWLAATPNIPQDVAEHSLQTLLRLGIKIDQPNEQGQSALTWLLESNVFETVDTSSKASSTQRYENAAELLLTYGADWNAVNLHETGREARKILDQHPRVRSQRLAELSETKTVAINKIREKPIKF